MAEGRARQARLHVLELVKINNEGVGKAAAMRYLKCGDLRERASEDLQPPTAAEIALLNRSYRGE
jgi:hypothetical protein